MANQKNECMSASVKIPLFVFTDTGARYRTYALVTRGPCGSRDPQQAGGICSIGISVQTATKRPTPEWGAGVCGKPYGS